MIPITRRSGVLCKLLGARSTSEKRSPTRILAQEAEEGSTCVEKLRWSISAIAGRVAHGHAETGPKPSLTDGESE